MYLPSSCSCSAGRVCSTTHMTVSEIHKVTCMSMEDKLPGWDALPRWAQWELSRFAFYTISDADVAEVLTAWLKPRLIYQSSWEYQLFLDWCSEHEVDPGSARLEDIVAERCPEAMRDDLHYLLFTSMYSQDPDHELLRSGRGVSFREQRLAEMMVDRLPQDIRDRLVRTVQYLLALCAIARSHPRDGRTAILSAGGVELVHYENLGPWISVAAQPHTGPCPNDEGDIMDKVEALWAATVEEYGYDSARWLSTRATCSARSRGLSERGLDSLTTLYGMPASLLPAYWQPLKHPSILLGQPPMLRTGYDLVHVLVVGQVLFIGFASDTVEEHA